MTRLDQFMQNARDIVDASPHVSIDREKLHGVAASFKQAGTPPAWNNYISDIAKQDPFDATRVLFEMALICAQQGGFITPDANGVPQKWNINGSGAAAMLGVAAAELVLVMLCSLGLRISRASNGSTYRSPR